MYVLSSLTDQRVFALVFCGGVAVGVSIMVVLRLRSSSGMSSTNKNAKLKINMYDGASQQKRNRYAVHSTKAASNDADMIELEKEQLSRTALFLGEEGVQKLQQSKIVVIGLGGVGSHAAHMLVRSGCRRIRLVDFDMVTLSSLNRHAVATRDDVGRPKVTVCAEHFNSIAPQCEIDARVTMFTASDAATLLEGNPDYVVDCIDDVKTKADLLAACRALVDGAGKGVPVMCVLGAGGKADPTRVLVASLADALKDPLAMSLKREMRFRLNAAKQEQTNYLDNVKVVYSSEQQVVRLGDLDTDQAEQPDAFGAIPGFRIRTMPVIGTMPAVFGLMAASSIMCEIAGKPLNPRRVEQIAQSHQRKLRTKLLQREMYWGELTHLVEDVWFNRSAFNDRRYAYKSLVFTRFDRSKPALPANLILVEPEEADAHDEETARTGGLPVNVGSCPQLQRVQKRLQAVDEHFRRLYGDNLME